MAFRKKYLKVLKKQLLSNKNIRWTVNQLKNGLLVPLTVKTKKCFNSPILCGLVVTYACNMKCKFCNLPSRVDKAKEISTEDFKNIISEFASLGSTGIGFTGGEPLLRADIYDLIKFAKEKHMATQLTTNGILLNEINSKKLIDAGLDDLGVSLESHNSEIHDDIRGVNGAFKKTLLGIRTYNKIKKASKSGADITVSTVLTRKNYEDIDEFIEFCKKEGIDNISFGLVQDEFTSENLNINDQKKFEAVVNKIKSYALKGEMVDNSLEYLNDLKNGLNQHKPCWAGYHSLYVDCFGNFFPCFYYMENNKVINNLSQTSVKEIWKSSEYQVLRKELLHCHDCFFICQMELNCLFNKFNKN